MKLFHVVLTESAAGDRDWQVRRSEPDSEIVYNSAPLGKATVYVLNPIRAKDSRDARVHALATISDLGLRSN